MSALRQPSSDVASPRRAALLQHRASLQRDLTGRFWLRLHASLIVTGTFAAGFVANFLLLGAGMHWVLPRWLLAIGIGYAMFFALVRLWLIYVGVRAAREPADYDGVSVPDVLPQGRAGGIEPPFRGGGGTSGGAGASGSLDGQWTFAGRGAAPRGGGSAFDLVDGDGILVLVIGLIVLAFVAVLAGGALHFVWMAPELLTDAAFGALLASGAIRGLRRVDEPDWNGSVFRATWKPLAAVVVVAIAAAWALGHWFPGHATIGGAWRSLH